MGQYANELYHQKVALEYEKKALLKKIEEYESGIRYVKLEQNYTKLIAGYKRKIQSMEKQMASERKEADKNLKMWIEQCETDYKNYQSELAKKTKRIQELEEKYDNAAQNFSKEAQKEQDFYLAEMKEKDEKLKEKEAIIHELEAKVEHMSALLNRDGTNTGTPTSQTSLHQKKRIPNSRKNTGKSKGGQKGHKQHVLSGPSEEEVNETAEYTLDDTASCTSCGANSLLFTGKYEDHYEYDVKIDVIKKRHRYYLYLCGQCGATVKSKEGPAFRSLCQYGPTVQALLLSLTNSVNAPINKAALFLAGITGGEIKPCEGYIAKLQPRAAKGLEQFYSALKLKLITLNLLYWDDTVIFVNTARACFRFYGNERLALFTAHENKGLSGLKEDNVLPLLTSDTKVEHDHNIANYNQEFHYQNLECNQHLERDVQKNSDDTGHRWSSDMKEHIATTIHNMHDALKAGKPCFDENYISRFNARLDKILEQGEAEYEKDKVRLNKYGAPFERALLERIQKYRVNYFSWVEDFSLPTTNNLSERSLRQVKSKMKSSGQFESIEFARYYAILRSYIETCRRNHINEIEALRRLCDGNPYTLDELLT